MPLPQRIDARSLEWWRFFVDTTCIQENTKKKEEEKEG
jgi:hypothetical protein